MDFVHDVCWGFCLGLFLWREIWRIDMFFFNLTWSELLSLTTTPTKNPNPNPNPNPKPKCGTSVAQVWHKCEIGV
jgi:hypothetical protein